MSSHLKDPSTWTTGADPPTAAQKSFLSTLSTQKNVPLDPSTTETKSAASQKIDELKSANASASENKTPVSENEEPTTAGDANVTQGGEQQVKDPSEWATGDEKATGKQEGYIAVMAKEAGEKVDTAGLGKSDASRKIGELKGKTGM